MATPTAGCDHGPTTRTEAAQPASPKPAYPSATVEVDVNGSPRRFDVHPDDSTLDAVRSELGLTGCKQACGHGVCGACTMQLDGTPVATCILPATAVHRRRLTTIEGIATGGELHAVQKAFVANDALQCGFCTPGFIVEGAAFVDAWRAEHGSRPPTRDDVAAALASHLCRCAAYDQIYAAIIEACSGTHDGPADDAPRYDAREKVTGEAKYTFDIALPGMLHAAALASPHAHARVTKLDWSRALAMPGVRGAVELLTAARTIRYAGQELVAIAAVDERTAKAAVSQIEIAYEVLPAAFGERALEPDAPLVYPSKRDRRHAPNATEGPLLPETWSGNRRGPFAMFSKRKGAARRAVADARTSGHVVDGTWTTHCQCHTALEPHVAVARFNGDALDLWVSTQGVSAIAKDVAERWRLREADVRVEAKYVGGAFGSKGTLSNEIVIAIELARVTAAPVRYAADRRTELMVGGNRPPLAIDLTLAVDSTGEMVGMSAVAHSYCGTAVGGAAQSLLRVMYPLAPRALFDYDVTTHTPPGKPFRAPNGPGAFWALEQAVDEVAGARGQDPVALRQHWDPNPARRALYAWVSELPAWRDRASLRVTKGRYRRGVGLAAGCWFAFVEPKSAVELTASSGGLRLTQASQDIGNGTRSVLARTVSERFGLPSGAVEIDIGDSKHPWGVYTAGSRTTSSIAPAADNACDRLQAELVRFATKRLGLAGAQATPQGIAHEAGALAWSEVFRLLGGPVSVTGRRKKDPGGYFLPPIGGLATERAISGAVVVTHIEVDTRLGKVRVLETWGGYGVGRIVHPELATSQAKGGVTQAISYALYEERRLDPARGYLLSSGLEDYRMIGIGDVGPIHVHFDQSGYEKIRGRQVGLGELVTVTPAAAIGNAMFHATGWRPKRLPLRPDVVLEGVRS